MGIAYAPLDAFPCVPSRFGRDNQHGLLRARYSPARRGRRQVASNSPAAQAGPRARDAITSIDGKDLKDESSLAQIINGKACDTLNLSLPRGSQSSPVQITLGGGAVTPERHSSKRSPPDRKRRYPTDSIKHTKAR